MTADAARLDHDHLWHPFTQQQGWIEEEPLVIERGEGCWLFDTDGRRYLDGHSSLWCNVHGHRHPLIDEAIREQIDRVSHSTMLGLSHPGAAELAARLVAIAPPGLSRVFYSDSGATAAEIALKMAFQYQRQRGGEHARRTSFVRLREAYHGDTIGSVSVGGIDLFHATYKPLLFDTHAAEPGDAADMERVLVAHGEEVAAVILEPLVQGAGGILVHPPGYLRAVRELCDRHGVLLICDEVATGFGRTGKMFACEHEDVAPDLLCVAKGITGGYLPLAATLTTEEVYDGFLGAAEEFRTFFHGHTYTGNPLACAAALANLDVFESERTIERLQPKIELLGELLDEVAAMDEVAEIRRRGFMVGIDLGDHDPALRVGHRVTNQARERGAIVRPLGNTVVLTPPLAISEDELRQLVAITADSIAAAVASVPAGPRSTGVAPPVA
ncbi:MAG: adenosylmethionine---8-amino-7-oxononanoate aminotransferase [Solirubrobacterales bacterium]|jgi:adenosylmethionine-8-amino-7-oxononanoate aminotransferase|nr:adenosylmethionine---8-amino-7-oxononanoate aminotransferase [Solirubrobacterales bacterium]